MYSIKNAISQSILGAGPQIVYVINVGTRRQTTNMSASTLSLSQKNKNERGRTGNTVTFKLYVLFDTRHRKMIIKMCCKGRGQDSRVLALAARLINNSTLMHSAAYLINRMYIQGRLCCGPVSCSLWTKEFHPFITIGAAVKAHLLYCVRVIVEFAHKATKVKSTLVYIDKVGDRSFFVSLYY